MNIKKISFLFLFFGFKNSIQSSESSSIRDLMLEEESKRRTIESLFDAHIPLLIKLSESIQRGEGAATFKRIEKGHQQPVVTPEKS